MTHLETHLPVVIKDMQVNYITLTKTCNNLIKFIKSLLESQLGITFPVMREEGDSNDHGVVYVVLHILDDNKKICDIHGRMKDRTPFEGGFELQRARDAFEKFFSTRKQLLLA